MSKQINGEKPHNQPRKWHCQSQKTCNIPSARPVRNGVGGETGQQMGSGSQEALGGRGGPGGARRRDDAAARGHGDSGATHSDTAQHATGLLARMQHMQFQAKLKACGLAFFLSLFLFLNFFFYGENKQGLSSACPTTLSSG